MFISFLFLFWRDQVVALKKRSLNWVFHGVLLIAVVERFYFVIIFVDCFDSGTPMWLAASIVSPIDCFHICKFLCRSS